MLDMVWSLVALLFLLTTTSTSAATTLSKTGGEVEVGEFVTITVEDKGRDCKFLLQLDQGGLCCYQPGPAGSSRFVGKVCDFQEQSRLCNKNFSVKKANGQCVLLLRDFQITDAGTYEAEGEYDIGVYVALSPPGYGMAGRANALLRPLVVAISIIGILAIAWFAYRYKTKTPSYTQTETA